jgi:hypothetical protein
MSKYVITFDVSLGHDHKIEKVDQYPETQLGNQLFCANLPDVFFWLYNMETKTIDNIRRKYAELRKMAEEL